MLKLPQSRAATNKLMKIDEMQGQAVDCL